MKKVRINNKLEAAVNSGIAAILMYGVGEGIQVMKEKKCACANCCSCSSKSQLTQID